MKKIALILTAILAFSATTINITYAMGHNSDPQARKQL